MRRSWLVVAFLAVFCSATDAAFVPSGGMAPRPSAKQRAAIKKYAGQAAKRMKEQHQSRHKSSETRRQHHWLGAAVVAAIAVPQTVVARAPIVIATLATKAWRLLPGRLPRFWQATGLTKHGVGQAVFMLSNVAYLYAGVDLLWLQRAPPFFGSLTLLVCGASCAYHAAQCLHGTHSEAAARTCTVDTALAVFTGLCFAANVNVDPVNASFALLSLLMFKDVFNMGYTTSHSIWHLTTAATAITSGGSIVSRASSAAGLRGPLPRPPGAVHSAWPVPSLAS